MPIAYSNTSRKLRSSIPTFEPSVYSTGTQAPRPYTPAWSEGTTYGAWYDWNSVAWAYNKLTGQDPYTADIAAAKSYVSSGASAAKDTAKSSLGFFTGAVRSISDAVGAGVAKYEADKKAAEDAAREAAAAEKRKQILLGVGILASGITGVVLVQRYRKNGKVF